MSYVDVKARRHDPYVIVCLKADIDEMMTNNELAELSKQLREAAEEINRMIKA